MVDQFEETLATQQWLSGAECGDADKAAFESMGHNAPRVAVHPNTFAWYSIVRHYKWAEEILAKSAPPKAAAPVQQEAKPAKEAKKQEPAKQEAKQEAKKDKKAVPTPEAAPADGEKKLSKKDIAKAKKAAEKQARIDERNAAIAKANEFVKDPNDPCADKFGDLPMNQSTCDPEVRFTKKYVEIADVNQKLSGKQIRIRGRLDNSRKAGSKGVFLVMRDRYDTIQCVMFAGDEPKVSPGMVKFAQKITTESIVEIVGTPIKPDGEIKGCTIKMELQINEIWCLSKSAGQLPFQLVDAARQVLDQTLEMAGGADTGDNKMPVVKQDVRLDNRIIDVRLPTNQAIFRLQSGVCQLFREFFYSKDFIEIHTPKLGAGGAEGGSEVFKLKYFDQPACLAQSPQLYKQMALCADLKRVIEIGPVFRAEDSNTNRHLCEFTGLDMEMEFKDHYFECLDILGEMMVFMVKNIKKRYAKELAVINEQYPFEEFKIKEPIVKLNFQEGVKLLQESGLEQDPLGDLSTKNEKALGALVKEKYDTDFYILYGFPTAARAFYSMPTVEDPRYSNSYDLFMRGEEITSGAQRIHDTELLIKQAKSKDIPIETIKDYVEAFKYGVPNHAGAGFGLERIVKFFCNLHNIRKTSLFPRDPKRLTP